MRLKDLLSKDSYWMKTSEKKPIVLSTRIRLARNLEDFPFPHVMQEDEGEEIEQKIAEVMKTTTIEDERLNYLPLNQLGFLEKRVLVEKHLISPVFAEMTHARGVALSESHKISVMVNEEDHLRIQVLMPGDNLQEALRLASSVDDQLEEQLEIAYKEKFGYLTSCPTNVGTGLRVSIMVHLPGLVLTNQAQQVLGALANIGLAVRGVYGEGSRSFGHIFQISNQITLGKSEEDTIAHLEAILGQIVEREKEAREYLKSNAPLIIEDKVWRARGILKNARLLGSEETVDYLSEDRLGIDMGILPSVDTCFVSLLVNSLEGCLQYKTDRPLDGNYSKFERANYIRKVYDA